MKPPLLALLAIFLITAVTAVSAHDGYQGLTVPDSSMSCCSNGDCGPVETREMNGKLQAHIVGLPWNNYQPGVDLWVDVPPKAMLPVEQNPKVGPSACWTPGLGLLCFLPGRGM